MTGQTHNGYEAPLTMPPVTPRTPEEAVRATRNVKQLAQDDQDAAYLLEVLGLIEASADTPIVPRKLSSRDKAAGAPRGKATTRKQITVEEHDERLDLLHEGLCDREIAERLGVDRTQIVHWRHHYKLPVNRDRTVGVPPTDQARRDAHARGLTDAQIAETEGVHREVICQWRIRRRLPVNAERKVR